MADEDCAPTSYSLEDCCVAPTINAPGQGPQGPPGPQGPQGPQGPPGESPEICPLFCGTGSPEGVVTSPIGGIYEQTDAASTSHSIWFKHSGTGNTGWRQWAGMRGGDGANTALRMGDNSVAAGANSIAFGEDAEAQEDDAIAIGHAAVVTGTDGSIAIGAAAEVVGAKSLSIGNGVTANDNDVLIGYDNQVPSADTFIYGTIVIGARNDGVSIDAGFNEGNEIVIGSDNIWAELAGFGEGLIVIGQFNEIGGAGLVAIGHNMWGAGDVPDGPISYPTYGVMIGTDVLAYADCFISVGYDSEAYGIGASAVGPHAVAGVDGSSIHTTALGRFASAVADQSVALGSHAAVNNDNGIAIGHNAQVNHDDGIAIGRNANTAGANTMRIGDSTFPIDTIEVYTSAGLKTVTLV